jgi:hypothetical protein
LHQKNDAKIVLQVGTYVLHASVETLAGVQVGPAVQVKVNINSTFTLHTGFRATLQGQDETMDASKQPYIEALQDHLLPNAVFMAELNQAAETHANQGIIVANMCDTNLKHYLVLWAQMLMRFGRPNYLILALDDETSHYCKEKQLNCIQWRGPSPKYLGYDKIKYAMTLGLLQSNVSVLFSEVDVFWLQDPLPYLLQDDQAQWGNSSGVCHWCSMMGGVRAPYARAEEADLQITGHALNSRVNVGFYFIRPNVRTVAFMKLLLRMGTAHYFNQIELDALLNNMDVPLGAVKGHSEEFRDLVWKKLDHNFFAGGDGVESYEHIVTVHVFSPMNKSALDLLHAGNRITALPPLLRRPARIYFYIRSGAGVFFLLLTKEVADSTIKPIVQFDDIEITPTTQLCVGNPNNPSKSACQFVSQAPLFEKYRLAAEKPKDVQWQPTALVRGSGSRVSYTLFAFRSPPKGQYDFYFWVQQMHSAETVRVGNPVHMKVDVGDSTDMATLETRLSLYQQLLLSHPEELQAYLEYSSLLYEANEEVSFIQAHRLHLYFWLLHRRWR